MKVIFIWILSCLCAIGALSGFETKSLFKSHSTLLDVYISGAITTPGEYQVPKYSKLINLVDQAGGFVRYSDPKGLKFNRVINNGEVIIVPFIKGHETRAYLLSATIADFTSCGIGLRSARLIFNYLHAHTIKKIDDLQVINGVGAVAINKLKLWFFL